VGQRSRAVQRAGREGRFRAALVGYTNAGKSSILRGLSGQDVFVEDRLFATLDPLTREVDVGEKYAVLVTDTVGFIRKLPHHLVASFRATLEETKEADLLLHVIDASHPQWEEQRDVVEEVLADIGVRETPVLYVFNKIDALEPATVDALRERAHNEGIDAVFVSAVQPDGLAPLTAALADRQRKLRPIVELRIPAGDGRLLAEVHRRGEVLHQDVDGGDLVIRARIDPAFARTLARSGADSSPT
jgi:GTP-binding protein HflX